MEGRYLNNNWNILKRKISALLIVSMLFSNLIHLNLYANDIKFDYQYVPEIEIENSLIDDGMFYMPYGSFEVDEKSGKSKYVFKIIRKGNAEKAEKVRLTMVDATGKYDKDYSIRVIDKLWFSENVHNKYVAKSMTEYMSEADYEEYNYSDAIIDGSILPEDIMTEKEKKDYVISDEEKDKVINDAKTIMDEVGLDGKIDRLDGKNVDSDTENENDDKTKNGKDEAENDNDEANNNRGEAENSSGEAENSSGEVYEHEDKQPTKEQSTEPSVSGFTNTDIKETTTKEETTTEEESTTEEETTTEEVTTTEEESTTEEQTTTEEETTKEESTTEEQTTKETTTKEQLTADTTVEKTTKEEFTIVASESEVIYGTEQV